VHHGEDEKIPRRAGDHGEFEILERLAVGDSIAYRVDVVDDTGMGSIAIGPNVRSGSMRGHADRHDSSNDSNDKKAFLNCQTSDATPVVDFHTFSLSEPLPVMRFGAQE
jgi:hypothetical protein